MRGTRLKPAAKLSLRLLGLLSIWTRPALAGNLAQGSEILTIVQGANAVYSAFSQFNGRDFDIQVSKSDIHGGVYWSHRYDGGAGEYANAIAKASEGSLYVVGHKTSAGGSDFLVLAYNPSGGLQWARDHDLGPQDQALLAATGPEGELYVVGSAQRNSKYALWVSKFGPHGNILWERLVENGYNNYPRHAYSAPSGDLVVVYETSHEEARGRLFVTQTIMYNSNGHKI